jgi:lipopolysaccharide heptosyltransferase I
LTPACPRAWLSASPSASERGGLKILILKPSSLGDVIHALPVLRLLKQHWPTSEIYWWLDVNLVPLLENDPDLAGIFPFERKRWASFRHWPEIAGSVAAMRRKQFDLAIDLQGLARSAMFAWLANAGLTVGLNNLREGQREGARAAYDLMPPIADPMAHAVDRYLAVLPALGAPVHWNFEWLPRRPEVARQIQTKWEIGAGPWIALLPGARWDNKRWPADHFRRLLQMMSEQPEARFVILGASDEREIGEAVASASPKRCLNLVGQTTLWEMIEWIRLTRLVVTNDTGPMHVAAALRVPVVALFGPTNPRNTGPYGQIDRVLQRRDLPCVPCLKSRCHYRDPMACLVGLRPEEVFAHLKTTAALNDRIAAD